MEWRWFAAIALILAVGCDKAPATIPTVDVAGTVTIGGKPVEGVEVRFITKDFEGYGKTNAQGKYQLVAGAQAGSNKVIFNKAPNSKAPFQVNPDAGLDEEQLRAAQGAVGDTIPVEKDVIPAEYKDRAKTPITFNVPEGGTESADFKLPG